MIEEGGGKCMQENKLLKEIKLLPPESEGFGFWKLGKVKSK